MAAVFIPDVLMQQKNAVRLLLYSGSMNQATGLHVIYWTSKKARYKSNYNLCDVSRLPAAYANLISGISFFFLEELINTSVGSHFSCDAKSKKEEK